LRGKSKLTVQDLADAFWALVDKNGPAHPVLGTRCWIWTGARDSHNYGRVYIKNRPKVATHVSWFLETGEWPVDLLCHKCDNQPCIRFDHLFEGSHQDNKDDALRKGRAAVGHSISQSRLTEDQVQEVLKRSAGTRKLARKFGVNRSSIQNILRGRTWKHLAK
jgi:hypothetical protein